MKTYDIGFYLEPALKLRMCIVACKTIRKSNNTNVRRFDGPPETAALVLKLYYQRTKIQPAAGDGGSSTKVVLPGNENPAGRRRRRFQYQKLYHVSEFEGLAPKPCKTIE